MGLHVTKKRAALVTGAVVVMSLVGGPGALAAGDDDANEPHLTGTALERASAAALAETEGGQVTATEIEDDRESMYEVEVTLEDGSQVDVELDKSFGVVRADTDDEVD